MISRMILICLVVNGNKRKWCARNAAVGQIASMHIGTIEDLNTVKNRKGGRAMSKKHIWSGEDEIQLLNSIEECRPLFDHYKGQSKSYTNIDVWNAIAGHMFPAVVVTGAACKRHYEKMNEEKASVSSDGWERAKGIIDSYERDLQETTFDGVSEILGTLDSLFSAVLEIKKEIREIKEIWE